MILLIPILWIVFAILIAAAADSRGRSGFGWFVLAIVLSPLLAGFVLLLMPNLTTQALLEDIAAAHGSSVALARIHERAEASRTRRIALSVLAFLAVAYGAYSFLRTPDPTPSSASPVAQSAKRPVVQTPDGHCTIEPFQPYPTYGCTTVTIVSPNPPTGLAEKQLRAYGKGLTGSPISSPHPNR